MILFCLKKKLNTPPPPTQKKMLNPKRAPVWLKPKEWEHILEYMKLYLWAFKYWQILGKYLRREE